MLVHNPVVPPYGFFTQNLQSLHRTSSSPTIGAYHPSGSTWHIRSTRLHISLFLRSNNRLLPTDWCATSHNTVRSASTYSSYNVLPCAILRRADDPQGIRYLAATLPPIVLFPFFFFFLYLSVFLTILLVLLTSPMTGLTAFRAVRLARNLY